MSRPAEPVALRDAVESVGCRIGWANGNDARPILRLRDHLCMGRIESDGTLVSRAINDDGRVAVRRTETVTPWLAALRRTADALPTDIWHDACEDPSVPPLRRCVRLPATGDRDHWLLASIDGVAAVRFRNGGTIGTSYYHPLPGSAVRWSPTGRGLLRSGGWRALAATMEPEDDRTGGLTGHLLLRRSAAIRTFCRTLHAMRRKGEVLLKDLIALDG